MPRPGSRGPPLTAEARRVSARGVHTLRMAYGHAGRHAVSSFAAADFERGADSEEYDLSAALSRALHRLDQGEGDALGVCAEETEAWAYSSRRVREAVVSPTLTPPPPIQAPSPSHARSPSPHALWLRAVSPSVPPGRTGEATDEEEEQAQRWLATAEGMAWRAATEAQILAEQQQQQQHAQGSRAAGAPVLRLNAAPSRPETPAEHPLFLVDGAAPTSRTAATPSPTPSQLGGAQSPGAHHHRHLASARTPTPPYSEGAQSLPGELLRRRGTPEHEVEASWRPAEGLLVDTPVEGGSDSEEGNTWESIHAPPGATRRNTPSTQGPSLPEALVSAPVQPVDPDPTVYLASDAAMPVPDLVGDFTVVPGALLEAGTRLASAFREEIDKDVALNRRRAAAAVQAVVAALTGTEISDAAEDSGAPVTPWASALLCITQSVEQELERRHAAAAAAFRALEQEQLRISLLMQDTGAGYSAPGTAAGKTTLQRWLETAFGSKQEYEAYIARLAGSLCMLPGAKRSCLDILRSLEPMRRQALARRQATLKAERAFDEAAPHSRPASAASSHAQMPAPWSAPECSRSGSPTPSVLLERLPGMTDEDLERMADLMGSDAGSIWGGDHLDEMSEEAAANRVARMVAEARAAAAMRESARGGASKVQEEDARVWASALDAPGAGETASEAAQTAAFFSRRGGTISAPAAAPSTTASSHTALFARGRGAHVAAAAQDPPPPPAPPAPPLWVGRVNASSDDDGDASAGFAAGRPGARSVVASSSAEWAFDRQAMLRRRGLLPPAPHAPPGGGGGDGVAQGASRLWAKQRPAAGAVPSQAVPPIATHAASMAARRAARAQRRSAASNRNTSMWLSPAWRGVLEQAARGIAGLLLAGLACLLLILMFF